MVVNCCEHPSLSVKRETFFERRRRKTSEMGDAASYSNVSDTKPHLIKLVKRHEVSLAELNSLSSSRAVYQKNGNIFFGTTIQKATAFEQKHLDMARSKLEKLNAS